MADDEVRQFRAERASMVYQDPGGALNPSTRIGPQVIEAFTVLGQGKEEARKNALAALDRVKIADPTRVFHRYPHQLSGGMQQRVVIAMALASDPKLLVLDEPTTGLDATVEASVLDLVRTLRSETNAAVLLIAHNLGVIRSMCDRVGVMYAGKIVEEGDASHVSNARNSPLHSRAAAIPAASWRPQEPARPRDDPGGPSPDRDEPADLRLRRPLPARRRAVPDGRAAGRGPRRRSLDALPSLRPDRRDPRAPESEHRHEEVAIEGVEVLSLSENVSKTFHQSGHSVPAPGLGRSHP